MTQRIFKQTKTFKLDLEEINTLRNSMKKTELEKNTERLVQIKENFTEKRLQTHLAVTETGASAWLNSLPMQQYGFKLSKQEFWDALRIRYSIELEKLPSTCVCDKSFNFTHAFTCKEVDLFITDTMKFEI